jgi:hypothetical protein
MDELARRRSQRRHAYGDLWFISDPNHADPNSTPISATNQVPVSLSSFRDALRSGLFRGVGREATMTMATRTLNLDRREKGNGLFFTIMSAAIAATVLAGFCLNMKIRHLDFGALPMLVHLHAALFAVWLLVSVAQTSLVRAGAVGVHRRLGWAGAALAATMVVVGMLTSVMAVKRGAVPFFWTNSTFLVLNIVELIAFAGLVVAAVAMRRRAVWHRRLMLCATIMIAAGGVGRLMPLPLLGPWAPIGILFGLLVFVAIGMLVDVRNTQRIHPAYLWGAGVICAAQILIVPMASTAPVLWITAQMARP